MRGHYTQRQKPHANRVISRLRSTPSSHSTRANFNEYVALILQSWTSAGFEEACFAPQLSTICCGGMGVRIGYSEGIPWFFAHVFEDQRESGVSPELPRSGKQVRTPR